MTAQAAAAIVIDGERWRLMATPHVATWEVVDGRLLLVGAEGLVAWGAEVEPGSSTTSPIS